MKPLFFAALIFVLPLPVSAALTHRYSFNETSGTEVRDSVGNSHGLVLGGAQLRGTGNLVLDGANDFVQLPPEIMAGVVDLTLECWVNWSGGGVWTRILEFGTGVLAPDGASANGVDYILISPHGGSGNLHFGICPLWPAASTEIFAPYRLPSHEKAHVAVTVNSVTRKVDLYHDGRKVASGDNFLPLAAIVYSECWLGRSHFQSVFNDPFFRGSFDEFRLYNHALSEQELLNSFRAGPGRIGSELGALKTLTLTGPAQLAYDAEAEQGNAGQLILKGDYEKAASVDLTQDGETTYESGNTNVITVSETGALLAIGPGAAVITARNQEKEAVHTITVTLIKPAQLKHRYSFNEPGSPVRDSVGQAHGITGGSPATFNDGSLQFSGDNFVDLPDALLSTLNSFSIEGWIKRGVVPDVNDFPQTFLSFGTSAVSNNGAARSYFEFAVDNGDGTLGFVASTNGIDEEVVQLGGTSPPIDAAIHWVVTFSTNNVRLFIDGEEVAAMPGVFPPKSVRDVDNWLGRSSQRGIHYRGSVDEFRIYSGVLTASQVRDNFEAGPSAVPGLVQITLLSLSDVASHWELKLETTVPDSNHGLEESPALNAWGPVTDAQLASKDGNILTFRIPKTTGGGRFFRARHVP